jgi:hypothetical protein
VRYELIGGPMDGEVTEVPDPPWPWLKIVVRDLLPNLVNFDPQGAPKRLSPVPVANYRLVRYQDGRLGYLYDSTDT